MEFVIYYAPGDATWERDLRGFESEEQAWQYLREHCTCQMCRDKMVEDPNRDMAGCGEWWVTSWEDWLAGGGDETIHRWDDPEPHKISVNLIAGSGTVQETNLRHIFSDMTQIIVDGVDPDEFEVTVTATVDESKPYDVYHYLHSTLAVNQPLKLHRALVTIHALDDLEEHRTFASKEDVFRKARRISAVWQRALETLVDRGIDPNKLRYTPAGVDLDKFVPNPDADRAAIREKFHLSPVDDDVRTIGMVVRHYVNGVKGDDFLRKTFAALTAFGLKYRFVFVGAGWKDFMRTVPGDVPCDFLERGINCDYSDYPELYDLFDVLLIPSKPQYEAGPVSLLEGLAKGLPVIATETGLVRDLLSKETFGPRGLWLVPYGDPQAVVMALDDWLQKQHEGVWDPLWSRNLVTSTEDRDAYTWKNWCHRFEALYREIHAANDHGLVLGDLLPAEQENDLIADYGEGTSESLTPIYSDNFNMLSHITQRGLDAYRFVRVLEDLPLVIVGLGPSLDDQMELLAEHRDRIAIMCGDAALPKLVKEGVTPDVVVVADPSDRQWKNFSGIDCSKFLTVLPTIVHPMTYEEARRSRAKPIWYNVMDDKIALTRTVPKAIGPKGAVYAGVLTSGSMIQIAMHMSAWPITFVGHDLCWYDLGKGYASGTDPAKVEFQRLHKMMGKNVFAFPDIHGTPVTTEKCFAAFRNWLDRYLGDHDVRVYNSTECGILHGENIDQVPFAEWLATHAKEVIEPPAATRVVSRYDFYNATIGDNALGPQYSAATMVAIQGRSEPTG